MKLIYWFLKLEWFWSPGLQKTEANNSWFKLVFLWFLFSFQNRVTETLKNLHWNISQKKPLLFQKQICWKWMFPDEGIPTQRVSVPAVTCPVPQPVPLKHDGSAAHEATSVSLPRTGAQCCSSGPRRHLWHTNCSHLPGNFGRETGHDILQAGRAACLPCRAEVFQSPAVGIFLQQGASLAAGPGIYLGCVSADSLECTRKERRGRLALHAPSSARSPLCSTEGRLISFPLSEVHMHTVAGKNTSAKSIFQGIFPETH